VALIEFLAYDRRLNILFCERYELAPKKIYNSGTLPYIREDLRPKKRLIFKNIIQYKTKPSDSSTR
jgi:hypothetical protein